MGIQVAIVCASLLITPFLLANSCLRECAYTRYKLEALIIEQSDMTGILHFKRQLTIVIFLVLDSLVGYLSPHLGTRFISQDSVHQYVIFRPLVD